PETVKKNGRDLRNGLSLESISMKRDERLVSSPLRYRGDITFMPKGDFLCLTGSIMACLFLNCTSKCIKRLVFTRLVKGNPFKDRKSTRLNSSHVLLTYAVVCLKK